LSLKNTKEVFLANQNAQFSIKH